MTTILDVNAREILDSRGNPALEVEFKGRKGVIVRAAVPSGASTGTHEAVELRDGGARYNGMGVRKAADIVRRVIAAQIIKRRWKGQQEFDNFLINLDGTANKRRLGANSLLACSMTLARLEAVENELMLFEHISQIYQRDSAGMIIPRGASKKVLSKGQARKKNILPRLFFNVLNGGKHSDSNLAVQEFMIAPRGGSVIEDLRIGSEVYHQLRKIIRDRYGAGSTNVGDEGGFACAKIRKVEEALDVLCSAINEAGYRGSVDIALDCAASEFFDKASRKYNLEGKKISSNALVEKYVKLVASYPIISIEDPFEEDDFADFAVLRSKVEGAGVKIVGDDLTVTNIKRIKKALDMGSISTLLLKINQIGTISEALEAARVMKRSTQAKDGTNSAVMVSHRSGETEDTFISHLAVGIGCGRVKFGAPCRGERVSKYNELLRIEETVKTPV